TIRGKIIAVTAAVTLAIAAVTIYVCSFVFQSFLRKTEIQSAEFNMQVISSNVSADLDNILIFTGWCQTSADISRYLDLFSDKTRMPSISSEDFSLRNTAMRTYERLKEEYSNTPSSSQYISRALISPENLQNYMQISDTYATTTSAAAQVLYHDEQFQKALNADGYLWEGFQRDPLLSGDSRQFLPIVRPIYSPYNSSRIGWIYITIPERMISDYLNTFPMDTDSILYITIGSRTYLYDGANFQETDPGFQIIKEIPGQTVNPQNTASMVRLSDGSRRYMVSCPLTDQGWYITQILSDQSYMAQQSVYNSIIGGIVIVILIAGVLLYMLLNRLINLPVAKLQGRISSIAQGDFSRDTSIEWPDEFGAIGRGINQMSEDVVTLMNKKVDDEKQKKDLEYQILQSQINPHFLYNTLNSIKWMATIQGAKGIGEMTTALARLMKNIAKGTTVLIPLKDELELVNDYFTIQQYRYGGSIAIEYQIEDESLKKCLIHRFTLQPIVENALFHGIEPKGCAGRILIRAWEDTEDGPDKSRLLRVSVTDNGIGMTAETIKKVLSGDEAPSADFFRHVGISNVNKRIQYEFGDAFGISIESRMGEDSFTTMTITLPLRTAERTETL
ncbi:MAG: histidine kinase, partial [Eubacteriales bacterium]|nr:histidine kinase [Eubacteriales bacterium]